MKSVFRSIAVVVLFVLAARPVVGEIDIPPQFADAPAIVLEKSQSWELAPGRHAKTKFKHRVLIRTRAGLKHADQVVHYGASRGELTALAARTRLKDGTVIKVPGNLKNVVVTGRDGDQEYRALQFTFPGAAPGAIVEWEYTLAENFGSPLQVWSVREDVPVLESKFFAEVNVRKGYITPDVVAFTRGDPDPYCEVKQKHGGVIDLVCRNVPAVEFEAWSPPVADLALDFHVTLRSQHAGILTRKWRQDRAVERWKTIRKFSKQRKRVGQKARELTKKLSDREKIDVISNYVKQHLEIREEVLATAADKSGAVPNDVDDVLLNGGGTPDEIVMLTMALLDEAGVAASPVLAHDRSEGRFVFELVGGADHLMLQVRIDGETNYLDPACARCAPGIPHWRYCDGDPNAILLAEGYASETTIGTVPSDFNAEIVGERVSLQTDGSGRVEGSIVWTGQHDAMLRERLGPMSIEGRRDWFRERLTGSVDDLEVSMSDTDQVFDTLTADYAYTTSISRVPGSRILVQPTDNFTHNIPVPVQEVRKNPLWIPLGYSIRKETVFELPAGYRAGSNLPGAESIDGPGLSFRSEWSPGAAQDTLVWRAILKVTAQHLPLESYDQAATFVGRVRKALRRGVVVTEFVHAEATP